MNTPTRCSHRSHRAGDPDEHPDADEPTARPEPPRGRPPEPGRARPLGLAPAHLDAHCPAAPAPAGPRLDPGLGRPAVQHRRAPGEPVEGQPPALAPIYDRLGLFSVYDSPWFSAIYILLMVSLVGCIIPRLLVYWRALRASPPAAPENLQRLPAYHRTRSDDDPGRRPRARSHGAARAALPGRRVRRRRVRRARLPARGGQPALPRLGRHRPRRLRLRQLFGYKGGVIVLVGKGFSNSLTQYDDFSPGSLFDPADLPPLSFTVDDFQVKFLRRAPARPAGVVPRRRELPASAGRYCARPLEVKKPLGPRRQRLPRRPRLRREHDGARRQRRPGLEGAGGVPPAGRQLRVLRRAQGPRGPAGPARLRRTVLPVVRQESTATRPRSSRTRSTRRSRCSPTRATWAWTTDDRSRSSTSTPPR